MKQLKISQVITNRDVPSINKYLLEISRVDLLSPDDEYRLTQKIRQGDQASAELLVKSNLRFVVSIAKQYQHSGLGLGDLINEGNIGLIKAAYRFDDTKGFKFISYAVWWIRQYILMAIAEQSRTVRLPYSQLNSLEKVKRAKVKLEQDYEREPSCGEIANYLKTSEDKVVDALQYAGNSISIDSPFSYGDDNTLLEVLVNQDGQTDRKLDIESTRTEILNHMKKLSPKEEEIIRLFFGFDSPYPLTLDDIGRRFSLTHERVRQIKEQALKRLSRHIGYRAIQ